MMTPKLRELTRAAILAVALGAVTVAMAEGQGPDIDALGPQVGDRIPAFSGVDQFGNTQTLDTVMKPNGAMVVFFRSADWCPYCKTQLVELQGRYEELTRRGVGLVGLSYDSTETLKRFADSRGITFPMVSDPGSTVIRRYGLLNTTIEASSRSYGIPFPGTFVVDGDGIVTARYFEEAYQERRTVASILVRQGATPFGPVLTADTPHLAVSAAISDQTVAPGTRVTMVFDVTPRSGMHVYAPGAHTYQVIGVEMQPQPWLRVHSMAYPQSEIYDFEPLDERVEVYMKPFRLAQDVTVLATAEAQKVLAEKTELTLAGTLRYQACDDRLCYTPREVPFQWTLLVTPLDRRPPGASR